MPSRRNFGKEFSNCLSSEHHEGGWRYHRALYVYYDSKEALFDTLVEECYSPFLSAYRTALDVVEELLGQLLSCVQLYFLY